MAKIENLLSLSPPTLPAVPPGRIETSSLSPEVRRRAAIKYVLDATEALAPGTLAVNKRFIKSEDDLRRLCLSWLVSIVRPAGEDLPMLEESLDFAFDK